MTEPLLAVHGLVRDYVLPRRSLWHAPAPLRALDGIDLTMQAGRSLGIVGESGSGKSTLARLVMALETPTAGSVRLLGQDLARLPAAQLRRARQHFQMVFQDPYGSLDPRQTVGRIIGEPLDALAGLDAAQRRSRIGDAVTAVGLRTSDLTRYPHEFSGGQRQRVAIARALVTRPRLIVADEPVSALDVSVQAQVLNLLQDLQRDHGVTYLLISHDLAVVDHVCADVAVIYRGRIVEQGTPQQLFGRAAHPYTRALIEAVPQADAGSRALGLRRRARIRGQSQGTAHRSAADATPIATDPDVAIGPATVQGCAFAPRCPFVQPDCRVRTPQLRPVTGAAPAHKHVVACHHAEAVQASTTLRQD